MIEVNQIIDTVSTAYHTVAPHKIPSSVLKEVYEFLLLISTPLIYIVIGIGANLTDHYRKGTLTKRQAVVSALLGFFCGFSSWHICHAFGLHKHAGYIVPVATMAGERIVPMLIANSPSWLKKIIEKKTK